VLRKRKDSYQITVSLGYDIHGKKLLETTTFVPDPTQTPKQQEKAAKAFAYEFEAKIKNGYAMDGRKITLKEFSDRWINEYAKIHLQPGGYSNGTIRKTSNVLSSLLRSAVEWEVIEQNPCDKVKPPSAPDTSENIKFFTPEQTIRFLDYLDEPYSCKISAHKRIDDTGKEYSVGDYSIKKDIPLQLRILLELAIYSGCRKAELLALSWSDINFTADTISISKAVTVVDGKPIIKAPKTKSSYRKVSIPHSLILKLKKLQVSQAEYRLRVGSYWKGAEWVFT